MSNKSLREVCAEVGVTRRTVQGYEKAGLVSAAGKNKYGYLFYDEVGIVRIRTIKFFQKIGLSIKEIQQIIDAPADIQKATLLMQLKKLEASRREISELIAKIELYTSKL